MGSQGVCVGEFFVSVGAGKGFLFGVGAYMIS